MEERTAGGEGRPHYACLFLFQQLQTESIQSTSLSVSLTTNYQYNHEV